MGSHGCTHLMPKGDEEGVIPACPRAQIQDNSARLPGKHQTHRSQWGHKEGCWEEARRGAHLDQPQMSLRHGGAQGYPLRAPFSPGGGGLGGCLWPCLGSGPSPGDFDPGS